MALGPIGAAANVARVAGATLLSNMLQPEAWVLYNKDSGDVIKGQYAPSSINRSAGGNYAEITALNRQNPFIQFLNGKTETLTVESMFFMNHFLKDSPLTQVNKLIGWTKADASKRRPPLLTFIVGTGTGIRKAVPLQMDVILTDVTNVSYDLHNRMGGIRQVTFNMEFMRYSGHPAVTSGEKEVTDTRYARAKEGDYYELLCQEEYGDPMIGVIIAQKNPRQLLLKPGDTVALPSLEGVRGYVPTPQSLILRNAFGRKNTLQKRLLRQAFERRAKPYMSFLFKPAAR